MRGQSTFGSPAQTWRVNAAIEEQARDMLAMLAKCLIAGESARRAEPAFDSFPP